MTGLSTKPLIVYVYTLQRIPRQTSHRLSSSPNLDPLVFWLGSDKSTPVIWHEYVVPVCSTITMMSLADQGSGEH